ncbi:MAG: EFR1 family ferrodoxin [Candidatus Aureabacteria bacterium]|nr:EFR1 family ferrodoxin [Candidatus Auribacterota bacterium]
MSNILYYFSGTGNSLKVAKDLSAELGETELVPITNVIKEDITAPAERVGIVFPVYCWGVPRIIRDFIERLKPAEPCYFFSVCTCGGIPAGTLEQLSGLFLSKGMKLNAGFFVKMPGNCVTLYGAFSKEKQNKMFDKSKQKIKEIASAVRNRKDSPVEKNSFFVNWLLGLVNKLSFSHFPSQDRHFWTDERCNSCGICEKICPRNNIRIENARPIWLHHCEQCMACIQWCPVESIQFKKGTLARKRYRHPEIRVQELFRGA